MCTLSDLIDDIRKSLNECTPSSKGGCGCNDRYSDEDIEKAIQYAINDVVTLRPDQFTEEISITIASGQCIVDLCEAGCDAFVKYSHSLSDPCYLPSQVCADEIGKSETSGNECFEWDSDALNDATVYQYYFDPKAPCQLRVDREDIETETEGVLVCAVYPDITDELPDKICKKFYNVVYHSTIYHLIDRDHRPTQQYIAYRDSHRDQASYALRDINRADGLLHGTNYLGVKTDDCD